MHYEELSPPPALRGLVHRLWILRGCARGGPFQRAMPDGRAELIFNLADPFECLADGRVLTQPRALLIGPSRRAMAIRPTGLVDVVGVRFRPEALAGWLRVRGDELADSAFALDEVPAPVDRSLPEQLADVGGTGARLELIEHELTRGSRADGDGRMAAAVDLVLRGPPRRPEEVARCLGISRRQLGRLFRERVGLGPNALARVGRFQRALRALESPRRGTLAGVAHRTGYFDQAHMTRDFRLFAGTTPTGYLRERRELTRHFLDSEA